MRHVKRGVMTDVRRLEHALTLASALIPACIRENFQNFLRYAIVSYDGTCDMGKRTAFEANTKSAQFDRDSKRQRIDNTQERNSPRPNGAAEEITSARDLQNALFFDQSSSGDFRSGRHNHSLHAIRSLHEQV